MPRPQTKAQILTESEKEHIALEKFLAALAPEQMTEPGMLGEWSVKDVLAHLYEWEQMVLGWLITTERGETPAVPAEDISGVNSRHSMRKFEANIATAL